MQWKKTVYIFTNKIQHNLIYEKYIIMCDFFVLFKLFINI